MDFFLPSTFWKCYGSTYVSIICQSELLISYPEKPLVWFRYIDDVFFIWTHGKEKYQEFLNHCNNNRFGMIFETNEDSVSAISVPFLDVKVILENGKLTTDLYSKPTDKFQYLNFASCHPYQQKASLPYSFALRIRRICSATTDLKRHCKELTSRLRRRGYKLGLTKRVYAKWQQRRHTVQSTTTTETTREQNHIFHNIQSKNPTSPAETSRIAIHLICKRALQENLPEPTFDSIQT